MSAPPQMLRAARWYAERGLYVFPIWPPAVDGAGRPTGDCTCPPTSPSRDAVTDGCENPGKHPMTLNGHLDATVDHEILEGWWGRHPTANVGIACGASRRVVLDIDPRHHGDNELAVLLAEEGQTLPETWIVGTSRGGSHVHLGWPAEIPNDPPPRFVRNLCPGVEVKAAGGYVVAPPSLHVTGDRYQFLIGAGPSDLRTPAMCPAWLWTRITREAAACDGTPSGPVACSLVGVLFEQHGLVRATLAPEKWAVTCPWEAAHTAGRALSGTVLFGPREPGGLGGFFCAHAHCADRDARAVLTWCSSGEIEAARRTLHARLTAAQGNAAEPTHHKRGVWDAITAAALIAEEEPEFDWLEDRLLAPGSLTEWFSPRGLGKSLLALALAVKLARRGHRVLLLDRDNSRREVRRRLRAWGAADLTTLLVKTRDEVPPLTDGARWSTFPFGDYKLVIIDSLDASMEGVGEQDSAKPSKAIAPLLDIAHRPNGPAMLVLGNTIKSGTHGRGSGVVEDRADISYEVRDATDLHPTGTKPWWTELPAAGRDAWAERATRRKGRDCIRLAFTQGKFRVGKEPDPFVYEVNLSTDPWTFREVTDEVEGAGRTACASEAERRVQTQVAAVDRLAAEVTRRGAAAEAPLNLTAAIDVLHADGSGVPRDAARMLLDREKGTRWRLVEDRVQRGHPTLVVGVNQEWPPEKSLFSEPLAPQGFPTGPFSPDHVPQQPEKTALAQSLGTDGVPDGAFSPAEPPNTPPREPPEDDVAVF